MVRPLGKVTDSIGSAMTEPIIFSKLEGKALNALNNSQDFHSDQDFDRRTPKERFFDNITVVNSRSFLPQISNLASQSGPCLISAAQPSHDVNYNTVNLNRNEGSSADTIILSPVSGNGSASVTSQTVNVSVSEPSQTQSATSIHSLEQSSSRFDSDSVKSAHVDQEKTTSTVIEASKDGGVQEDNAVPCIKASQLQNLKKRRKSGKKKYKSTGGRQNIRSTSRKSKRGGQKQAINLVPFKDKSIKNESEGATAEDTAFCTDSKVKFKLKLSHDNIKRITNIAGAYSTTTDSMGQRASRIIKPFNGAKDNLGSDSTDLLALYSQPVQVSQKQRPTKTIVTVPTPLFVPKPPKLKNTNNVIVHLNESPQRHSVATCVDVGDYVPYRPAEEQYAATRGLVRVYLSERQSGTIKLHGQLQPGAPPATPTPAQLSNVIYIPSMNDIKAQRELKMRLEVLDRQDKKRAEKRMEENIRKEMNLQKEKVKALKNMQRLQIYALNEVMTQLELERFEKFKQKKQKHLEKDLNDIR